MMTGSQNSTCCSYLPDIYLFQPDPIYQSVYHTTSNCLIISWNGFKITPASSCTTCTPKGGLLPLKCNTQQVYHSLEKEFLKVGTLTNNMSATSSGGWCFVWACSQRPQVLNDGWSVNDSLRCYLPKLSIFPGDSRFSLPSPWVTILLICSRFMTNVHTLAQFSFNNVCSV